MAEVIPIGSDHAGFGLKGRFLDNDVEDEQQMRTMLEDNLEFDGYRVTGLQGQDTSRVIQLEMRFNW